MDLLSNNMCSCTSVCGYWEEGGYTACDTLKLKLCRYACVSAGGRVRNKKQKHVDLTRTRPPIDTMVIVLSFD